MFLATLEFLDVFKTFVNALYIESVKEDPRNVARFAT